MIGVILHILFKRFIKNPKNRQLAVLLSIAQTLIRLRLNEYWAGSVPYHFVKDINY